MSRNLDGFDLERHEDRRKPGIPDVSYGALGVQGWIELKVKRTLSTTFTVRNLKPTQLRWLRNRGRAGGRTFLLVEAYSGIYIMAWEELTLKPRFNSKHRINFQKLAKVLTT